jgi:hypothetical protein
MNAPRFANALALCALALGSLQMAGYFAGSNTLKGLGAVSTLAPFPKVFSDVDGVETFAADFSLLYDTPDGAAHRLSITPEVYARFQGPYNRRNVYGAALSYGPTPRFPPELFNAVFRYGLVDPGPLAREIGVPENASGLRVHIRTRTRGRNDEWVLPRP